VSSWKDTFKREQAKCSADPYLVVHVGSNEVARTEPKLDTLNPEMNEVIHAGINFPDDWMLSI